MDWTYSLLQNTTSDGHVVVRGRKTRVQASARPDHVISEAWDSMSAKQRKAERKYAEDIQRARAIRDRAALRVWTWEDKQAKRFRTTSDSGPVWHTVERRITYDLHTGAIIRDENVKGVNAKNILYAVIPDGPRDITTVLYYRPPAVQSPLGDAPEAARTLPLLDRTGPDFGNTNSLCRDYCRRLVEIPTMPLLPDGVFQAAHRDKLDTSPVLVTRNLNRKQIAALQK